MTAKAHGLEEEAKLLLDASGLTEDKVTLPTIGTPTPPPAIIVPTHQANWPVKSASHTFFEKALLGEVEGLDEPSAGAATNGLGDGDDLDGDAALENGARGDLDEDDAAAGWDMGDDLAGEVEADFVTVEGADVGGGTGSSEADQWTRNSPIAADHVAGGSFESAMALLHRQVGAVAFAPLRPRFMEVYRASRTFLPATAGLPPLANYVRRTVEATDLRRVLPAIPRDLDALVAGDLAEGHAAMKANRLEDCARVFRRLLHALLVGAVGSQAQVAEAKRLIGTAAEYVVAVAVELERRGTGEESEEGAKRNIELAAYFTIPKLEVVHRQLALMAALRVAMKHKNYSTALSFANRVIANGVVAKHVEQVRLHSPHHTLVPQSFTDVSSSIKGQEDQGAVRAQPDGQDRHRVRPLRRVRRVRRLAHAHLPRHRERGVPLRRGQVPRPGEGLRVPRVPGVRDRGAGQRPAAVGAVGLSVAVRGWYTFLEVSVTHAQVEGVGSVDRSMALEHRRVPVGCLFGIVCPKLCVALEVEYGM